MIRYLQCLTAAANPNAFKLISRECVGNLWKLSVTLLQAPNTSSEAVRLVTCVINSCSLIYKAISLIIYIKLINMSL